MICLVDGLLQKKKLTVDRCPRLASVCYYFVYYITLLFEMELTVLGSLYLTVAVCALDGLRAETWQWRLLCTYWCRQFLKWKPSQYISLPDIETWSICLYLGSFIMFSLLIDALQLWGIHSITCAGCHDLNLVEEALLLLFTVPSKNMCPIQQCPQDTWKQLRNPEKSFSKTLEPCTWTLYLLTNSQNLLPETILYYMVHCAWLCMTLRIFVMKENKK